MKKIILFLGFLIGFVELQAMQHPKETHLYDLLNISPNASENEIKKAFRTCASKCHPDCFSYENEKQQEKIAKKFSLITEAYDILKDEETRTIYNSYGFSGVKDFLSQKSYYETRYRTKQYHQETLGELIEKKSSIEAILDVWREADSFYNEAIKTTSNEYLKNDFNHTAINNGYIVASILHEKKLHHKALYIIDHILKNYTMNDSESYSSIVALHATLKTLNPGDSLAYEDPEYRVQEDLRYSTKKYHQETLGELIGKNSNIEAIINVWQEADLFYYAEIKTTTNEDLKSDFNQTAINNGYIVASILYEKKLDQKALSIIEHILKNYTMNTSESYSSIVALHATLKALKSCESLKPWSSYISDSQDTNQSHKRPFVPKRQEETKRKKQKTNFQFKETYTRDKNQAITNINIKITKYIDESYTKKPNSIVFVTMIIETYNGIEKILKEMLPDEYQNAQHAILHNLYLAGLYLYNNYTESSGVQILKNCENLCLFALNIPFQFSTFQIMPSLQELYITACNNLECIDYYKRAQEFFKSNKLELALQTTQKALSKKWPDSAQQEVNKLHMLHETIIAQTSGRCNKECQDIDASQYFDTDTFLNTDFLNNETPEDIPSDVLDLLKK